MSAEITAALRSGEIAFLDSETLTRWVVEQRWFGAKGRDLSHLGLIAAVPLGEEPPLALAVVEARFHAGTHELYQLLLGEVHHGEGGLWAADGRGVDDVLATPGGGAALARLVTHGRELRSAAGRVVGHPFGGVDPLAEGAAVRAIGAEQSNTSIVVDDAMVLKAYRRVEAGDNPELEMLRFLTARGFEHVPALLGWYDLYGPLMDATLGLAQAMVPGARDGWELVLDRLAEDPDAATALLRPLGEVTGRLHAVLASDATDPTFAPEEPSTEALGLLTAMVDEEIERVFRDLPQSDELGPIAGRGEEIRDRLRLLSHVGAGGRLIRQHGDLHLGQALLAADDRWVLIDFEGEPARPLRERRRKRSPLRDVAGMLRSFAYAASALSLQRGIEPPAGWEDAARAAFLDGYLATVEPTLLPAGQDATEKLLSIFELEKAVYELRYEVHNRPDWVPIPVAGILRILDAPL